MHSARLPRFSAIATALLVITLAASCKKHHTAKKTSGGKDGEPVAPGAVLDSSSLPKQVDYDSLGYAAGDIFTLDDEPFTGVALRKHSNGKLKARYHFANGKYDGLIEEWYENGVRSTYKIYKAGKRHGVTTYWDDDGTPNKQALYQDDELVQETTDPDELAKLPIASRKSIK